MFNRSIAAELDYGITDKLSVTAVFPYVSGKYTDAEDPPDPVASNDACRCLQSDWQDFSFSARYRLFDRRRLKLVPSVSIGIPSHAYEYIGATVPGRHLKELTLAMNVYRRLDLVSRNASFSARYSYTFVERLLDISTNRSNLILEGDYKLGKSWVVRGIALLQRTHGGLRFPPAGEEWEINRSEKLLHRNRLFRDNHFRIGAGATYQLGAVDLLGSMIFHVTGTNTHVENILTIGVRWPFSLRRNDYKAPSNQ
jgi:hypothetical protein